MGRARGPAGAVGARLRAQLCCWSSCPQSPFLFHAGHFELTEALTLLGWGDIQGPQKPSWQILSTVCGFDFSTQCPVGAASPSLSLGDFLGRLAGVLYAFTYFFSRVLSSQEPSERLSLNLCKVVRVHHLQF